MEAAGFAEKLQEQIFAGAHPVLGALERLRLRFGKPEEFRGRITGVDHAAGALVLRAVVDALRESFAASALRVSKG